jgi:hypothetical protein
MPKLESGRGQDAEANKEQQTGKEAHGHALRLAVALEDEALQDHKASGASTRRKAAPAKPLAETIHHPQPESEFVHSAVEEMLVRYLLLITFSENCVL